MNDAEMHLAHRIGIVVEQSDDPVFVLFRKVQFLLDLPGHRRMVGRRTGLTAVHIDRIHVAAHPH